MLNLMCEFKLNPKGEATVNKTKWGLDVIDRGESKAGRKPCVRE